MVRMIHAPSHSIKICQFNEGVFELKADKKAGDIAFDFVVRFETETTAALSYLYEMCPSTGSVSYGLNSTLTFTGTTSAQLT